MAILPDTLRDKLKANSAWSGVVTNTYTLSDLGRNGLEPRDLISNAEGKPNATAVIKFSSSTPGNLSRITQQGFIQVFIYDAPEAGFTQIRKAERAAIAVLHLKNFSNDDYNHVLCRWVGSSMEYYDDILSGAPAQYVRFQLTLRRK